MIPQNVLSTKIISATFLYPDGIVPEHLTEDFEMGGLAIQDTSKGVNYQPWKGGWNKEDNTVYLTPNLIETPVPIFTEPNVFEFSFTFDQNMRWVTATLLTDSTLKLRWYDSSVATYVTTIYEGITGFKLALDDKRDIQVKLGYSDVLFTYIQDNKLYIRNQRERFLVPHLLLEDLPTSLRITNFGMNEVRRIQWRFRYRRPGELLPWLL